jgi:hypothetical protein
MIDQRDAADAGAYLARVVRLDPAALVRLRPAGGGMLALWARLPFDALVTRTVRAVVEEDATVRAADLLAAVGGAAGGAAAGGSAAAGSGHLARHDARWRWPLPPSAGRTVERLPAGELHRVGAAAASTLREAAASGVRGRAVGERMLRDALLAHVPIVVTADDGTRVEVAQRLVQAVVRMGFLGPVAGGEVAEGEVEVRLAGAWVGLVAAYGSAWHRPSGGLGVRPVG